VTGGSQEATGTPRSPRELDFGALAISDEMDLPPFEMPAPPDAPRTAPSAIDATRFAHASEAEMARILDFYQVRWEYEPTTFPILWNLDGEVVESFAPDFYLPDIELFLEMTTLRQRLVRKKNRKLRRLRELYPDIRIKLFYARDFRAMMLKYGRLGLAESLSGTPGQVVPDRLATTSPPVAAVEPAVVSAVALLTEVELPTLAGPRAAERPPRASRRHRRMLATSDAGAEREAGA
jgi:hypothetical protein